jgi:hypothetical protein
LPLIAPAAVAIDTQRGTVTAGIYSTILKPSTVYPPSAAALPVALARTK